ncbi:carbohydrate-binding protein [Aquimarina sp. 2201CG14-23]|uniref:carbohydrate-binding protein n=1 Tax=Aquimarina mycalae TaxID=3040073 RepID=UPI002478110E|nr:carbohydrate-binding protein [Aquimarina sp. 2201CG14-23]MDH7444457.1 carbohydrate-binding protein [Aquimarina sp. 2201CG14-23]
MKLTKLNVLLIFLFLGFLLQAQTPEGELKRWHKVTLTFNGPNTSETANPNPYSDYRLEVTFTHQGSNRSYKVPGYFAACGNAENNGCDSGNKWRVHFAPDQTGTWNWTASFKSGSNVAINTGGSNAGFMNGDTGSFDIAESNKSGRDFRSKNLGRLKYVGQHYLRHIGTNPNSPNGDWFIKAGADAPENTLAYDDFDNTPNRGNRRKSWNPHQQDYVAADAGDYTWNGGKGTELLGVVKYLSDKGVNAFSFLTLSLHGDDENVFPHALKVSINQYNGYGDGDQWNKGVHKDRFDVSKLAQWEKIFEYADKKGMYMHFKTMETENDNIMDGNAFGRQRKLYYRELIARFGHHLALNWNLTEETTIPDNVVKSTASYIKQVDPYDHLVVIHTYPGQQDQRYNPLLGNNSELTGASIQTDKSKVHNDVKRWIEKSKNAGKKWVVANDEQGNAQIGVDQDGKDDKLVRHRVLWGALMAGGAGVEYYYGYSTGQTDLTAQNHRSRDGKYADAARALRFFNNYLQDDLITMTSSDGVTSDNNDYVLAKAGEIYAVYRPNGGTTGLSLPSGNAEYNVQWYNPRSGSGLTNATTLNGNLVAPDNNDWVALIKKKDGGGGDPDQCVALEQNGVVAVEAEHFDSQSKTDNREWYVLDGSGSTPTPDPDPDHSSGASGGGYLEILPDTRVTHDDPLVNGVSFSNTAGQVAIINYKVKFTTPGKYFVWVRAHSTGSEDNGVHVGLNGNWPASGNRMQWCSGKNQWTWESKQRTNANHCGEAQKIYLDIPSAGIHTISFSMREDGFEMDKFVLSKSYTKPSGNGPDEVLVDCGDENKPPQVSITSPVDGANFEIGQTIPLVANASDTDGTIAKVEFFINNSLAATEQVIPYETSTTIANVGNYTIIAKATDNDGAVTTSQSVNITVEDNSVPPTDVINIPGSFEAEDFELKSGSVRIENTPGTASDKNLGYIRNGDFANYSVNVDANSEYTFDVYASSKGVGGTIDILESGSVVGSINIPVTGQWHNYKKYTTTVSLSSGEKTLRLSFKGGSGYLYNIDKIKTTKVQPVEQTVALSPIHDAFLQGSTRYNSDMVRVELNRRTGYLMFDLGSINGTITKADLKFTVYSDAGNGNITIHKGNNNNWTETNLSNANKPAKGTQLGTLNANFPVGSTKTIPLKTAQISKGKLSLIIDALSGNDFAFASKENGSVASAQLVITYTTNRGDLDNSEDITLYPNPAVDMINFSGATAGKIIKIFNTVGVLVKQVVLQEGQNTVDISHLSSGYYIVNILEAGKTNKILSTKKVLKR